MDYTMDCAMDCGLRTTDYGLRTTDYGLRTTDYGLRTTDYGLGKKPGLGINADYALRTGYKIWNPV